MIKRIMSICVTGILIFSVIGCSEKGTTNNLGNEASQATSSTEAKSSTENVNNVEDSKENTASNKEEKSNNQATNASNSSSTNSDSVNSEEATITYFFSKKGKIELQGKINNNLDIHMELTYTDKKSFEDIGEPGLDPHTSMDSMIDKTMLYEGSYYYDQYKKNIRVEAEVFSNGYFTIIEFDENNNMSGYFGGFIGDGNILRGRWDNNKDSNYPFYLVESGAAKEKVNIDGALDKIGDYCTKGSNDNTYSENLMIIAATDDKFKFHICGFSSPNIGNIGGVAYYTNESKKEATFSDGKNCNIKFVFDGNTIKVSGTGMDGYAGAHVRMDGTFEKK